VREHGVRKGLYSGARQTLEVVCAHRLHLGGRRSDAEELRAHAQAGGNLAESELADVTAKVFIYEAFVEGRLEAPKQLARAVHDLSFEPKYEDFGLERFWSLSNAFTSAFKELDPIPQFNGKAGQIPGNPVLAVVLVLPGGLGARPSGISGFSVLNATSIRVDQFQHLSSCFMLSVDCAAAGAASRAHRSPSGCRASSS